MLRTTDGGYVAVQFILLWGCNILLYALGEGVLNYEIEWPDAMNIMSLGESALPFAVIYFLLGRPRCFLPCVLTIHFVIMLLLLMTWIVAGTFFCEPVLYLVYDTSLAEVRAFCREFIRFRHVILLLLSVSAFAAVLFWTQKLRCAKRVAYLHGLLPACLLALLFLIISRPWRDFPFGRIVAFYNRYPLVQIHGRFASFSRRCASFIYEFRHRNKDVKASLVSSTPDDNKICGVFVIGESAIRSHHSIYGYPRRTTPNLERHISDIVAFEDLITVQPTTIIALKYLLTDMTLENRHLSWTVFDALKAAGYRIDILSNQNRSGWADSPVNMIYGTADSLRFMHEKPFDPECHDGVMLPQARDWLSSVEPSEGPSLLVLHLMGSHINWKDRVPPDFDTALQKEGYPQDVNDYDATICYTDYILGSLIDELSVLSTPAYLIYISDHGAVCDYGNERRHPLTRKNSAYEVPFIVWTNKAFRESRPDLMERLKAVRQRPLQMDRLHYGLLEIMGVKLAESHDSENFLSTEYRQIQRTMNQGAMPYVKNTTKDCQ